MSHVIVVGSGIAGLIAALETSSRHAVTLVTKSKLSEGNTRYAQGGIAAAMFEDDSVAEHIADTLRAGAGLCQLSAVEVLCSEGPERIRDLIKLGVGFDRLNGELARGLEAAHSQARVLHAGGDATGLAIETALVRAVHAAKVKVLEHTFALDLVTGRGRVCGLEVMEADRRAGRLDADAVVLASGGAGQLYKHTTNPTVATGDGVAAALRAGAQIADVEFYQFHPTALAVPGNFLISEAVRGDGAVLLDVDGRRFMTEIDARAELAPRDVVARGIAAQMERQGGRPVMLDATALGANFLAERFPTIDAACRSRGLNWGTEPIPVTPAAHYWMGGVRTDVWGRTSVPGLFAIGEVACTGVHGANRLASNSLLESLVFAWRCAHLLLADKFSWTAAGIDADWGSPMPGEGRVQPVEIEDASASLPVQRAELQQLMWDAAGIHRDGRGLRSAVAQLRSWKVTGSTVRDYETANLLTLARAVVEAALGRRESRGAHFRRDFPNQVEGFRHQLVFARKVPAAC